MDENRVREICQEVFRDELLNFKPAGVSSDPIPDTVTDPVGICSWLFDQTLIGILAMFNQLPDDTWALFEEAWRHYIQLYIDRAGVCTVPEEWRAFTLAHTRMKTLGFFPTTQPIGWQAFLGMAYAFTAGEKAPTGMTRAEEWRHVDPVEGDPAHQPSHR